MGNRSSRSINNATRPDDEASPNGLDEWELSFVEQTVNRASIASALKQNKLRSRNWVPTLCSSRRNRVNAERIHKLSMVKCFVEGRASVEQLETLVREATNLQNLRLETHGYIHGQQDTLGAMARLLTAASETPHTALESLTLSTMGKPLRGPVGAQLGHLLECNRGLTELHLNLTAGDADTKLIQHIAQGLQCHDSVKLLSLTSCAIHDDEFAALLAPALHSMTNLEALDISSNKLTQESLPVITSLLNSKDRRLEYLDISGQKIFKNVKPQHVASFIKALKRAERMEYLAVNSCHMNDEVATPMIQMLTSSDASRLQQVDFGFNKFGHATFDTLMTLLPQMKHVLKLKIHGAKVSTWSTQWTKDDSWLLLQALAQNQSIHCLSIDSNLFSSKECFGTLEAILRRNFLLEKAKRVRDEPLAGSSSSPPNAIPVAFIPHLLARIYDPSSLERKAGHTVNHELFQMIRYEWMPYMCNDSNPPKSPAPAKTTRRTKSSTPIVS